MVAVLAIMLVMQPMLAACAQSVPQLGSQVWIEPGQTEADVDHWFALLEQAHMPVARIFIMWPYVEAQSGTWDFSLYDRVFQAADRHHVRIVATLTPSGFPLFLDGDGTQGLGLPKTEEQELAAENYIRRVVQRYRSNPALDSWILLNEPGQAPSPTPRAQKEFARWLAKHYGSAQAMSTAWGADLHDFASAEGGSSAPNSWNPTSGIDWLTFWRQFQTDQLRILSEVVRAADPKHGIHVNPHALLSNVAALSDDLPAWRPFLDSLGCSIHPAWHFGLLSRDRYALGVSYINDLVAGSITPKPYWVTELQGGNNISSGIYPTNPTSNDIAQWVWTSIGSGAERVIFWLLNARSEGTEAAEWSLLDFQQQPSERLVTASRIAQTLTMQTSFFSNASTVHPPITLITSLDTMTYEAVSGKADFPGRGKNAQLEETLGFYEALSRLGPPPAVRSFDDFDWESRTPAKRIAVLPDIRSLSIAQIHRLETFSANGNTLLITGLTGFYDPGGRAWVLAGFPLESITGAELKEVRFTKELFTQTIDHPPASLPVHLWESSIRVTRAVPIAEHNGTVTATSLQTPGGGRVVWVPSLIGLGAWLQSSEPLANFLGKLFADRYTSLPFRFATEHHTCLLRVLQNGDRFTTIVTNGAEQPTSCMLTATHAQTPESLWGTAPTVRGSQITFTLQPKGTSVVLWK
jgi:beta-galactosidase